MFDKLKKALSGAAKSIGQKEINAKILDDTLLDLQLDLLESDVAQEVVDELSAKLKNDLLGLKLEKGQDAGHLIESKLKESVVEIFGRAGRLDLVERIQAKKIAKQGPFVIVFLGINGTGKTTTVAKIANLLRKSGISVVVAAGDTHRAGAIEQLTQHAERLSLKVISQRYGADPSAVGRDAVDYAKKHYVDAVLIDTAGRMQTSKNLMDEMSKIIRVVRPDIKLFVGDSLAGNDTINQAREFFQYAKFDGAILTKIDADAKGGSAISIAYLTSKPIAYVGIGQGYDDVIPFDSDKFILSLFGNATAVSVKDLLTSFSVSPSAPTVVPPSTSKFQSVAARGNETSERPIEALTASEKANTEPTVPEINSSTATAEPPHLSKSPPSTGGPLFSSHIAGSVGENIRSDKRDPDTLPSTAPIFGSGHPPSSQGSSPSINTETSSGIQSEPVREKPQEEKKSRFRGLFGRKKESADQKSKYDYEKQEPENRIKDERSSLGDLPVAHMREEASNLQTGEQSGVNARPVRMDERSAPRSREDEEKQAEERRRKEKEDKKKDNKKRKDDKDSSKKDEIVYLTDEDIEDLIK